MKANITIVQQPMNTDRAYALGLVFKLQYVFRNQHLPGLEIFPDNEVTKALEWEIYGATDDREDLVRIVEFDENNHTARFELEGMFEIKFTGQSEQKVNYAKIGPTMEKAYHFQIEVLNPN